MSDAAASGQSLTFHVEMTLPPAAFDVRDALDEALHRSDRRVGVITGGRDGGLYLGILTRTENDDAARSRALRLVTAALENLGLGEVVPDIQVGDFTGRPTLAGGPRDAPRGRRHERTCPDLGGVVGTRHPAGGRAVADSNPD